MFRHASKVWTHLHIDIFIFVFLRTAHVEEKFLSKLLTDASFQSSIPAVDRQDPEPTTATRSTAVVLRPPWWWFSVNHSHEINPTHDFNEKNEEWK